MGSQCVVQDIKGTEQVDNVKVCIKSLTQMFVISRYNCVSFIN